MHRLFHQPPTIYAQWISHALLVFLGIALVAPWDALYKAVFYLGVAPLVILYAVKTPSWGIRRTRPFWVLALLLIGYIGISSLFVSQAPFLERFTPLKYGVETTVFLGAAFIACRQWFQRPVWYGTTLLVILTAACLLALILYFGQGSYPQRLEGLGFLDHTVIGATVIIMLWAISMTLLTSRPPQSALITTLAMGAAVIVVATCLLMMSRGPLLALTVYGTWLAGGLLVGGRRRERIGVVAGLLLTGLISAGILTLETGTGMEATTPAGQLLERGDSHRLTIWSATLEHPPASLLFGAGYATPFFETPAGAIASAQVDQTIWHPHNLLLSVYYFAGLMGLALLAAMVFPLLLHLYLADLRPRCRWLAWGLVLLVVLLNTTSGAVINISPDPIWLRFWFPLVLLAALIEHHHTSGATA